MKIVQSTDGHEQEKDSDKKHASLKSPHTYKEKQVIVDNLVRIERAPRFLTNLDMIVKPYKLFGRSKEISVQSSDISISGVKIISNEPIAYGTKLSIKIFALAENKSIAIKGMVVRCKKKILQNAFSVFEIGIRFKKLASWKEKKLASWIEVGRLVD